MNLTRVEDGLSMWPLEGGLSYLSSEGALKVHTVILVAELPHVHRVTWTLD